MIALGASVPRRDGEARAAIIGREAVDGADAYAVTVDWHGNRFGLWIDGTSDMIKRWVARPWVSALSPPRRVTSSAAYAVDLHPVFDATSFASKGGPVEGSW
jgi:hypothetical protein